MVPARGTCSNCPRHRSPRLEHVKLQKCTMKHNCIGMSTRFSHPVFTTLGAQPVVNTIHTEPTHTFAHQGQSRTYGAKSHPDMSRLDFLQPQIQTSGSVPLSQSRSKREECLPLFYKFWLMSAQAEPGTPVKQGWRNPPTGMRRTLRSRSWAAH